MNWQAVHDDQERIFAEDPMVQKGLLGKAEAPDAVPQPLLDRGWKSTLTDPPEPGTVVRGFVPEYWEGLREGDEPTDRNRLRADGIWERWCHDARRSDGGEWEESGQSHPVAWTPIVEPAT